MPCLPDPYLGEGRVTESDESGEVRRNVDDVHGELKYLYIS